MSVPNVETLEDYTLLLTFDTNETRIFNVKPYLEKGIFKELKYLKAFTSVRVDFDTIPWSNGADLDPEVLYEDSLPLNP